METILSGFLNFITSKRPQFHLVTVFIFKIYFYFMCINIVSMCIFVFYLSAW